VGIAPFIVIVVPDRSPLGWSPVLGAAVGLRLVIDQTLIRIDRVFVDQAQIHQRF
jgi:hypothetical protein